MAKPKTARAELFPPLTAGCLRCPRTDHVLGRLEELAQAGWTGLVPVPPGDTAHWQTHVGHCPDCSRIPPPCPAA